MIFSSSSGARRAWPLQKSGTRRAKNERIALRAKAWTYETPAGVWRIKSRTGKWYVSVGSVEMGPFLSLYQALDWVGTGNPQMKHRLAGPPLDIRLWQPEFERKFK